MYKQLTGYLVLVLLIVQLAGCATGAQAPGMTVLDSEVSETPNPALVSRIQVGEVSGGKKTNPLWKSNISTDEFKLALESSLKSLGYFSDDSTYMLSAELQQVDQPIFGLNYTVTSTVGYELVNMSSGEVVFADVVTASSTTGVNDAFLGVKRLRLANEGSIKANIKSLLDQLAELEL